MNQQEFQGIDASWLAIDAVGRVAIFTTGGAGPIPDTAIASASSAEELVHSLPESSDVSLLAKVPRSDDFIAFARRGFFAYDWSDVHRPAHQALDGYELQAITTRPILLTNLPDALRALAASTPLASITFGDSIVLVRT